MSTKMNEAACGLVLEAFRAYLPAGGPKRRTPSFSLKSASLHGPQHHLASPAGAETFSIGLEKPCRIRMERGLNEHLGRHEYGTGPLGKLASRE